MLWRKCWMSRLSTDNGRTDDGRNVKKGLEFWKQNLQSEEDATGSTNFIRENMLGGGNLKVDTFPFQARSYAIEAGGS